MSIKKIAVVGYGYRMPGGINSDDDFWKLLSQREVVRCPVEDRYGPGYEPFTGRTGPSRFANRHEGLMLEDKELRFDCRLFGLSPYEAEHMDPQIKLLLSSTWEAFENSGWDLHKLKNSKTGVFIGTQISAASNWRSSLGVNEFSIPGCSISMFANRISYHFNLMGPSTTTMTACSSGISALHTAMNSLKCGDCEQAIVGSSNYLGSFSASAGFGSLGVISPDGRCYSFDAKANGYMRSEGVFVFVLKPLDVAERDGDSIHGIISETMLNTAGAQEGTSDLIQGRYITAPTSHGQVALMQQTCKKAGISPQEFDYIEAHATGTKLGDRIEGNAIGEVFGGYNRKKPLKVAAVKSNLGHMEAAAFHCSMLKTLLMFQRRTFAPISKNYKIGNPEIDFEGHNMEVLTECEPFPNEPVIIGINSFGFGGANGICVMEEYIPDDSLNYSTPIETNTDYLFPVSARSTNALAKYIESLQTIVSNNDIDLYTLAGNLSQRKTHFNVRSHFIAGDKASLLKELENFKNRKDVNHLSSKPEQRILMIFSGQGTQWETCGKELYVKNAVFRKTIDTIDGYWNRYANFSLRDACLNSTQEELDECQLAQPSIFMIQCGLVELFKTWGVYADGVIGHSAGEMGAAYASGLLSLEDASRLVFQRANLQQKTAGSGRMLAVALDRKGIEDLLHDININLDDENCPVAIACINAPASIVLCGTEENLNPIIEELNRRNYRKKLLAGNIAFHSSAMDVIKEDILSNMSFLNGKNFTSNVPFISSVTGKVTEILDATYWWSNVRQAVLFETAIETAKKTINPTIILEVSPHPALTPIIQQCYEKEVEVPLCIGTLVREKDTSRSFYNSLGHLYQNGIDLDFAAQFPRPRSISHILPGHVKEEQVVIDKLIDNDHFVKKGEYSAGPLLGKKIPQNDLKFEVRMSEKDFPWLADHKVQQMSIVPAAGYIELILQALNKKPAHFSSLQFLHPCVISQEPLRLLTNLKLVPGTKDKYDFTISSKSYRDEENSTLHCQGKVEILEEAILIKKQQGISKYKAEKFKPTRFSKEGSFYEHMSAVLGNYFQYGPYFQAVKAIDHNPETKEILLDLEMDLTFFEESERAGYMLPPSLMDGALQAFIYFLMKATDIAGIPMQIKDFTIFKAPLSNKIKCHFCPPKEWSNLHNKGQLKLQLGEQYCGSVTLYDEETGELIAHLGQYSGFHTNIKRGDLIHSKKRISWQPKFVNDAKSLLHNDLTALNLIEALENRNQGNKVACRIMEITDVVDPDKTILKEVVKQLIESRSPSEYQLYCSSEEAINDHYNKFNHFELPIRFKQFDIKDPNDLNLERGLIRKNQSDLIILNIENNDLTIDQWVKVESLLIPGGIVLVTNKNNSPLELPKGWYIINENSEYVSIQTPLERNGNSKTNNNDKLHLISGYKSEISDKWISHIDDGAIESFGPQSFEKNPVSDEITNIDFFWNPDQKDPTGEMATVKLVELVQNLINYRVTNKGGSLRLSVITLNSVYNTKNPSGAALWGAIRSMTLEVTPELGIDFRLVDLGGEDDLKTLKWLVDNNIREKELAIRHGKIYVPRVVNISEESPSIEGNSDINYRLFIDNPGQITGLLLKTYDLPALGPNDVEIEVDGAAINFRDIMVALGRLPLLSFERSALGNEVGMEASGRISKIGTKVKNKKVGDEVLFMKGGCIANRVVTHELATFAKPKNLSQLQAAGVLSVYVTAYYALVELSRLKRGQKFLIHSAMGGVGQSAIALAKHIGAEIYATAGTVEKREKLLELGVKSAYDSHSYQWYDDLMADTNNEGVDVVLNSLSGHHIILCLEALKPGGWHCEIGKVDIYSDNALHLSVFRKNLRFLAIDVDRLMKDDPALSIDISQKCLDLIEQNILPPLPITTYKLKDYLIALRSMMNGEHQGKLILEMPKKEDKEKLMVADDQYFLDPSATYLVTGGLGGFGLMLLPYLCASGAKHITLMDRDKERKRSVEWVRQQSSIDKIFPDIEIDIVQGDSSIQKDVNKCIHDLTKPLKGVFHLAGIIDDQMITNLTPDSVKNVFNAKANGALYLHEATVNLELDHFVVSSSVASVFGSPGQINYCAANAFLDELMQHRVQNGLPGLSFNMGAIAEAGMASRDSHVLRMTKAGGIPAISASFAFSGLDYALRKLKGQSHLICALFKRIPWTVDHPDYMRFGSLIRNQDCFSTAGGSQITPESISSQIVAKLSELCGHEEIDVHEPLASFGLNSISVSELAAFINAQFNYQVSIIDLMTKTTTEALVHKIINKDDHKKSKDVVEEQKSQVVKIEKTFKLNKANHIPSIFAHKYEDHFTNRLLISPKNIKNPLANDKPNIIAGTRNVSNDKLKLGALDGTLPIACQQDLSTLYDCIRNLIPNDPLPKAIAPSQFKKVFLTGATGFFGRFMLRELLDQNDKIEVYCLVRAENEKHGLQRIIEAMKFAEIWKEEYLTRIIPIKGDIGSSHFGTSANTFDFLCKQMDAVYHFAADITLQSPYNKCRKVNTVSMQNVYELCFTVRYKHVFYASTMGIFPEYFCQFGKGFGDSYIDHQAQPNLESMIDMFPLGLIGYPWSKIVVEQSLYFAKSAGLPIAIFRLPVTGMAASTGFTQVNDIRVRIAISAIELGIFCKNMNLQWSEPVDTISNFCTSISLNDNRKNTIYQCCNPNPDQHGLNFSQFGFDLKEVSYPEFKSKCLKEGEKSPLNGHWTLVDYFAPYWFEEISISDHQPISDRAIQEDCPYSIEWPGLITITANSNAWIQRHKEDWVYPTPKGSINLDNLLNIAKEYANQNNVSFEEVYPPNIIEPLQKLIETININKSKIKEDRLPMTTLNFSRKLYNLATLAKERRDHPEISSRSIEKPIFIVGINRTGTTFLHNLLSKNTHFETLTLFETTQPVIQKGDYKLIGKSPNDPRKKYIKDLVNGFEAAETLKGIHKVDIDQPEEEFYLLEQSFLSWTFTTLFDIPEYGTWLKTVGLENAYKMHHQIMQHFDWQHQLINGKKQNQWLFKMPFHLMSLEDLIKTYPDAVFIQTHRNPLEFMSSWNHLVYNSRSAIYDSLDKARIGQQQLKFMGEMLNKSIDFRKSNPVLNDQWIDIDYRTLIKNPMSTIDDIHKRLDIPISSQTRSNMGDWIKNQALSRSKVKRNAHKLEDFMITEVNTRKAFASYIDFIKAKGIIL